MTQGANNNVDHIGLNFPFWIQAFDELALAGLIDEARRRDSVEYSL